MPRRILLLITDLEIGGTPTVVRELAMRLHAPPEVEIEVACLSKWGPVADQIKAAGVRVTPFGVTRALQFFTARARLVRLVRERAIDTVFSFLIHSNAVSAAASRKLPGVRFLQSIQTTQPWPQWHWLLQMVVKNRAERIVVPSPSAANAAQCNSAVPREQIVVIPNAVDVDRFREVPHPPADARPFPVGFLGRLDRVKCVPNLVEAVHQLDGLVHLHVFGDGPDRRRIEGRISELGAGANVTMHGAVSRPEDALRQVGLLVLPSEAEGFGLVLIEAMAAGIPVIASNAAGIRDVVADGRTGLLVGNVPQSLAGAIRAIVEKPQLRERLARDGAADVRRRFTWEVVLPQYRAVLGLPTP